MEGQCSEIILKTTESNKTWLTKKNGERATPDNLFVFILNFKSKADKLSRKQNANSIVESGLVLSQLDMPDFVDPPHGKPYPFSGVNARLGRRWKGAGEGKGGVTVVDI